MDQQILEYLKQPRTWQEIAQAFIGTPPADISRILRRLRDRQVVHQTQTHWSRTR